MECSSSTREKSGEASSNRSSADASSGPECFHAGRQCGEGRQHAALQRTRRGTAAIGPMLLLLLLLLSSSSVEAGPKAKKNRPSPTPGPSPEVAPQNSPILSVQLPASAATMLLQFSSLEAAKTLPSICEDLSTGLDTVLKTIHADDPQLPLHSCMPGFPDPSSVTISLTFSSQMLAEYVWQALSASLVDYWIRKADLPETCGATLLSGYSQAANSDETSKAFSCGSRGTKNSVASFCCTSPASPSPSQEADSPSPSPSPPLSPPPSPPIYPPPTYPPPAYPPPPDPTVEEAPSIKTPVVPEVQSSSDTCNLVISLTTTTAPIKNAQTACSYYVNVITAILLRPPVLPTSGPTCISNSTSHLLASLTVQAADEGLISARANDAAFSGLLALFDSRCEDALHVISSCSGELAMVQPDQKGCPPA